MTLEARVAFVKGSMWTLRQWLLACRGRSATDPRDLVFGGLSLIKPETLRVDQSLLLVDCAPLDTAPRTLFPLRRYYPQLIPPRKTTLRPSQSKISSSTTERTSLLPDGLWPALKADYTVDIAEVFVNTAACLITHTGTREVLSVAARTSCPEMYLNEWWLSPSDKIAAEELPSWAPSPGSWTVSMISNIFNP